MQDLRRIQSVGGHVFAAVRRAFGRIFLAFLGGGVVGAGAVLGTAAISTHTIGQTLTTVAAVVFGVVVAYAAALTVAVTETVRALIQLVREASDEATKAEKAALTDVTKATGDAGSVVGNVVKAVEGQVGKLEHRA